ncbi:MAG: pilus assembly protein TadG-related protein [Armatimonadota bacterium]
MTLLRLTRRLSTRRTRTLKSRRAGSVLLISLAGLLALLGCAALTIDVGAVMVERSRLQAYCDAAALAGGAQLPNRPAANDAAASMYQKNLTGSDIQPIGNGGTYSVNGDSVTVTTPYSDAFTTAANMDPNDLLKVTATSPFPLTLSRALGLGAVDVTQSAVALRCGFNRGMWGAGEGCLFAKDLGFDLACNGFNVNGSVISNGDIDINLNTVWIGNTLHAKRTCSIAGLQIRGGFNLEYGRTYRVTSNNADIAAITRVPEVDLLPPVNFDPANFATDFDIHQTFNGDLSITGSTVITEPGTYYVTGNLNINANNTHLNNTTFIVGGSVHINTNNLTLGYHEKYMSFYLLGGGTIDINQNNVTVNGDLYAPNGYIVNNSNNVHKGAWIARKITVNCNNFGLDGLPGRSGGNNLALVE